MARPSHIDIVFLVDTTHAGVQREAGSRLELIDWEARKLIAHRKARRATAADFAPPATAEQADTPEAPAEFTPTPAQIRTALEDADIAIEAPAPPEPQPEEETVKVRFLKEFTDHSLNRTFAEGETTELSESRAKTLTDAGVAIQARGEETSDEEEDTAEPAPAGGGADAQAGPTEGGGEDAAAGQAGDPPTGDAHLLEHGTNAELKARLKELGVRIPKKANKASLQAALKKALNL